MTQMTATRTRLDDCFARLKEQGRGALVTFITAGDPDYATSLALLKGLPEAGADIIELGMPFSDPMADGPAIQEASQRALKAGMSLQRTLDMVAEFRKADETTPIILMGYYNPVYHMGVEAFLSRARKVGVDGLIIVDLPPEEDRELCIPANEAGLAFIRLATPTTDEKRLPAVLNHASGFIYYVSIAGITGTASADNAVVAQAVERIRSQTALPVCVGFGIKTPEQVADTQSLADGAVVGSAIVARIAAHLDADNKPQPQLVPDVLNFVKQLAGRG